MVDESSTSVNRIYSEKAKIKEYIVISYNQIIRELPMGEGQYLDSLVSMLKIEDSNRSESIKKIKSLSETYTIIPEFAEQVTIHFEPADESEEPKEVPKSESTFETAPVEQLNCDPGMESCT